MSTVFPSNLTEPMELNADLLRFVLGLKLKALRQQRGLTLQDVASQAGLSISYLSEIEKGKKFPKPDKLIELATVLSVSYEELISPRLDERLDPLAAVFSSAFVQEFPFELFGLTPEDLFQLFTDQPTKAGALVRTFLEIGKMYDVQVEHFLFAALRSYQQLHTNYFPELEEAARSFRAQYDLPAGEPIAPERLRQILETTYGYRIDTETLPRHPVLHSFRSVFADGPQPVLFVNGRLLPAQQAFILARELGYRFLNLKERAITSSWLRVESFDQVLNNFRASYFAGALLLDEAMLCADLRTLLTYAHWDASAVRALLKRYGATPEMLCYRFTELIPKHFGLRELFFLRLFHRPGTDRFQLTKVFNLSCVPVPHGIGLGEHYCRRWPALQLMRQLAQAPSDPSGDPLIAAARMHFINENVTFFTVALARPLVLTPEQNACVAIGFLLDERCREQVRFAQDPALPDLAVNLTCERCPLTDCAERAAEPEVYWAQEAQREREAALEALLETVRNGQMP